jgi:hypothetical protein
MTPAERRALRENRLLARAAADQRNGEGWAAALARTCGWIYCAVHCGLFKVRDVRTDGFTLACGCRRSGGGREAFDFGRNSIGGRE